uniref:Uncharacterized protein n=1 Tax=viral metagenome TaxID=1070528 RepID=A0A6C0H1N8_9ZZZZ
MNLSNCSKLKKEIILDSASAFRAEYDFFRN